MIPDALLSELAKAADSADSSSDLQGGIERLTEAFSLFSQETVRLEQAYSKLQKRFKTVNTQLEESHRNLEEKVQELDLITHYLNSILHHMNQGILFVGSTGVITTYNTAAEKILGIKHKSVLFQYYWDVFPDEFFGFSMQEGLKNVAVSTLSSILLEERELEIETSCVRRGAKANQGVILLIRDITEMRRLQKEASRKDRMQELGEMAAAVAHEIRNPLGGIQGYASLLHRDLSCASFLEGGERGYLRQMASHIIEGSKQLGRLVEDVLEYARPIQLQKEMCDLSLLLRELRDFVQVDPNFPKEVSFQLEIDESPLLVLLDRELFRSGLLNMIFNSLQAMPEGGVLTIQLNISKEKIFLSISDTGLGIESQNLEKIFTPYFTTKERGNGLGLCETYKIIEAHFGAIEVRSQVGLGTTFTITLPLRL
jgi:PAS domain S-box-containing protein